MIKPVAALTLLSLAACGGGGTASSTPTSPRAGIAYTAGLFPAASGFASQCAVPRTGTDPSTGRAYTDRAGSVAAENHFLRSWSYETYLWYDEIPDRNPSLTATTLAYFDLLKTPALLQPSGQAKDRFHFTYGTAEYQALAQSGIQAGYGIAWAVPSTRPPRKVQVSFTEPGSPAALASPAIGRGAELLTVDNIDVVNDNTAAGVDTITAGMYPSAAGQSHRLVLRDRGASVTRSVTLVSANVTSTPVQNARVITPAGGTPLGYLLFNDHIATAERGLVDAITLLKAGNVQDLVLDLRYNGGGYLDLASELAYMIAGPARTSGRTFERLQFSSKYPSTNPVTGGPITATPFLSTTQGFSVSSGQALPTLNLGRVFVLTSADTCSASESVMNSLQGIGVSVVQIGTTTCGKPYGFYPEDNCGTTYFSIQFRGVNAAGFGDYAEGFASTAARSTGVAQANLPGCATLDDLNHDLGDVNEAQLAAALTWRATGSCPAAPALAPLAATSAEASFGGLPLQAPREPWRENRVLR
jgi:hypothetical protein